FTRILELLSANALELLPLNAKLILRENLTYPLACNLLSGVNVNFKWYHNNVKLTNSSDVHIENSSKFSFLTFRNVQLQHTGTYEWRVTYSFGQNDTTRPQLTVQGIHIK